MEANEARSASQALLGDLCESDDAIGRLLRQVEIGNAEAGEELLSRCSVRTAGFFSHFSKSSAGHLADNDDLAQVFLLELWQKVRTGGLANVHVARHFWHIVEKSAGWSVLSQRRRECRKKRGCESCGVRTDAEMATLLSSDQPVENQAIADDEANLIMLLSWNADAWPIYMMRDAGLSPGETAERLHTSLSTVNRKLAVIYHDWQAATGRGIGKNRVVRRTVPIPSRDGE